MARIKVLRKWTQGNQVVLVVECNYKTTTKRIQASFPLTMIDSIEQIKAFLEEVYEANKPRKVDLSIIPEVIE